MGGTETPPARALRLGELPAGLTQGWGPVSGDSGPRSVLRSRFTRPRGLPVPHHARSPWCRVDAGRGSCHPILSADSFQLPSMERGFVGPGTGGLEGVEWGSPQKDGYTQTLSVTVFGRSVFADVINGLR